jgi:hypothetical protein
MKKALSINIILLFLGISMSINAQTKVCVIGEFHEESELINPDTLFQILEKIKPDLILIEMDSTFFTKDFNYDFEKDPDILSTNQNIASYRYQQKYKIPLRPYDISGRNEFFGKENYFEKESEIFNQIRSFHSENKLSKSSENYFEIFMSTLDLYAHVKYNSLKEVNSDLNQKFTELKYQTMYDLMIAITQDTEGLKEWIPFAQLQKDFWVKRNEVMAENIVKYAKEFENKTIVVFMGFEHKYFIVNLLNKQNVNLMEYWEFEN